MRPDIDLYMSIIQTIFSGRIPFVDFYYEYPPFIFLSFFLPGLWAYLNNFNFQQFTLAFYLQNIILIYWTAVLVKKYRDKNATGIDIVTIFILLGLYPVSLGRMDLFYALSPLQVLLYLGIGKKVFGVFFLLFWRDL